MSDSRPTESLIEEVAADAAAAYDDLESDADSMPDLESLSDTDSIMDLIDDATPFPDYVLQDLLLSLERNGIHPREYDNAMEYYTGHTYALHLDAAAA